MISKDKIPAVILISLLLAGVVMSFLFDGVMLYFMGGVLLFLSSLKLLNLKGFVVAYRKYDLLAQLSKSWTYVYPFVELALGLAFIFSLYVEVAALVLLFLMIEQFVSVMRVRKEKKVLMCACMGTLIKVKLTTLTLIENVIMGGMAFAVLTGFM